MMILYFNSIVLPWQLNSHTKNPQILELVLHISSMSEIPVATGGYSTDREYQRPVEPIKQLPKKRIRIKGSVRASMISYREIHRAPLGKSFSIHDGPLKVSYSPADKK